MNLIKDAVNGAAESMVLRFLRNSGIEGFIDRPKDYKLEMTFLEDGAEIKIIRKEGS